MLDAFATDAGFRDQLQRMVDEAKGEGVVGGSITQAAWADHNVQIAGVSGSTITVGDTNPSPPHER